MSSTSRTGSNDVDLTAAEGEDRRDGGYWSTHSGIAAGTWLAQGDHLLEPINPDINWLDPPTSVESQSWGRIKAQF